MKKKGRRDWRVRIFQQDALDFVKGLKEKIDLFCIDPPYGAPKGSFHASNLNLGSKKDEKRDSHERDMSPFILLSGRPWLEYMVDVFKAMEDKLTPKGNIVLFLCDHNSYDLWHYLPETIRWHKTLQWYRPWGGPAFAVGRKDKIYGVTWPIIIFSKGQQHYENAHAARPYLVPVLPLTKEKKEPYKVVGNLWYVDGDHRFRYFTNKPLKLMEALLSCYCPPGGLVVDCFAGSGSTGEAAVTTGRRALLADIGDDAIDAMKLRLLPYKEKL